MPRVIFICPYLKGNNRTTPQRRNYVKYIATREGVDIIGDSKKLLPGTWRQKKMIEDIIRDFPDTTERFEYEDYIQNPTRENASTFISAALEQNLAFLAKRDNYVNYIARRPRAERMGAHGLFSAKEEPIVLDQVANMAAEHPGNVWMPIISLRREDAARLGYDNAENWRAFLSSYTAEMAQGFKINPDRFRWYAAYHDEGHHPHVHVVCWSDDPREGFLTKKGIRDIKAGLASRIFRQELLHIYEQQTTHREKLNKEVQREMETLITEMEHGVLQSAPIEGLIALLVDKLRDHKGKRQYGYLPAPAKDIVDKIVDELAMAGQVASAYDKWCESRLDILRTYMKEPPHPGPLSQQKELRRIRNIVVEEAVKIASGDFIFEETMPDVIEGPDHEGNDPSPGYQAEELPDTDAPEHEDLPSHAAWNDAYRAARKYLFGSEDTERNFNKAFRLFEKEAYAGNALAMHDLARMYTDGLVAARDPNAAHDWYAKALIAFIAVEDKKADRYIEYRIGKMYAAGLGTDQDHSKAADWFRVSSDQGYKYAQYYLAGLHMQGKGVTQDHSAAYELYAKSAAQDFPYASFELGKMCKDGVGTQTDQAASALHFHKAYQGLVLLELQSHDDKLQYRLGWMLENGVGIEKDAYAAMKFYEEAAGVGNIHAQYRMANLLLMDGAATPERVAEAVELLEESAAGGSGPAVYALARLYYDGQVVQKDTVKAVGLFVRAATEYQNEYAAYRLGILYLRGEEIPEDIHEAVRWLSIASERGNQYAQYALAMVYLSDQEIPKDISRALLLLQESAIAGNGHALYRLGRLYLAGDDVFKDIDLAIRYLTGSAERGNQYAQYTLGKLYLTDGDIPRNREQARYWLEQSAQQGNEYAWLLLEHFDSVRSPPLFLAATRLLHHMGRVFRNNSPTHGRLSGSESKQRRKEHDKKVALGHASDEHELNMN